MPDILRPDFKALVWLAIGFLVVPMAIKIVKK